MISDKTKNEMENTNGEDKHEKEPEMEAHTLQKGRSLKPLKDDPKMDADETTEKEKLVLTQNNYEAVSCEVKEVFAISQNGNG